MSDFRYQTSDDRFQDEGEEELGERLQAEGAREKI